MPDALDADLGHGARHVICRGPLLEHDVKDVFCRGLQRNLFLERQGALNAHGRHAVIVQAPAPHHGGGGLCGGSITLLDGMRDRCHAKPDVNLDGPRIRGDGGLDAVVVVKVLGMRAVRDCIQPRGEPHHDGAVGPKDCPGVGCRGQDMGLRLALGLGVQPKGLLDDDAGHVEPVVHHLA